MIPKIIIEGKIISLFPSEIAGQYFEKRIFWVEEITAEVKAQTWQLELHQNDCNMLDKYKPGDIVSCNVEVKGTHYSRGGKEFVYNALKCTLIKKLR